jgi:hypothetical protein
MDQKLTTLERAFQIARSGDCEDIAGLKKRLNAEGYSSSQVEGPQLRRQLLALITQAKSSLNS